MPGSSEQNNGETTPLIGTASSKVATIKDKIQYDKIKNGVKNQFSHTYWKRTVKFIIIAVLMLTVILQLLTPTSSILPKFGQKKKRNMIFFVTDGMGPASLSLTRSWRQFHYNLTYDDTLTLDKHFIGSSRTRSSSSLITDSAAGATAFSCALKSYNGAIGVDPSSGPCGTILESAKLHGYLTGLVVTTRITDATPAAFSSHVDYRSQEDQIAEQQLGFYPLGRMVDLMIGGGRSHYVSRSDDRNLLEEAEFELGWNVINNRTEFDMLKNSNERNLPLLALLADGDIPFDLDRDSAVYPSLEEEALLAIEHLHENSEKGFFLMIEGSRIDHAGHQNDAAAQVREVLAFDRMFASVLQWAQEHPDEETILFSTSDHETGGLTTAKQLTPDYPDYIWYPEFLDKCKHSGEFIIAEIYKQYNLVSLESEESMDKFVKFLTNTVFEEWMGLEEYTQEDINDVLELVDNNLLSQLRDKINGMISYIAQIGWSTHGHSAVDVNTYMYANNKNLYTWALQKMQGNVENIDIGKFMEEYLGLDLQKTTDMVKDTKHGLDQLQIQAERGHDEYGHIY